MNTKDIAWLAGLLEGEGHFAFNGTPTIKLAMTDGDIVKRASQLMAGTFTGPHERDNPEWTPIYKSEVWSSKAVGVMLTILPLMGHRRGQRIREVIAKWKAMPGNANAAKTHCKHGHPFSAENTYYRSGKKNERACRACGNARSRRYQKARKAMDE